MVLVLLSAFSRDALSPVCRIFSRPLIGPQIVAGSTKQQTVGRINQAAECGDEDEDKDENEDEDRIPYYAMLLTSSVKRFSVSCMQDFLHGMSVLLHEIRRLLKGFIK